MSGVQQVSYAVYRDRAVWGGRILRDWADDLVDLVVTEFDPRSVIVFGSVADGADGPDSDIDVLVVFDDAPRSARRELMVALRRATHQSLPHTMCW